MRVGDRGCAHVVEDGGDRRHLVCGQGNPVLQLEQMGRAGHAVEFGRLGKPPAAASPEFGEIVRRQALDRPGVLTGVGR